MTAAAEVTGPIEVASPKKPEAAPIAAAPNQIVAEKPAEAIDSSETAASGNAADVTVGAAAPAQSAADGATEDAESPAKSAAASDIIRSRFAGLGSAVGSALRSLRARAVAVGEPGLDVVEAATPEASTEAAVVAETELAGKRGVIELAGLSKRFGDTVAVNDIALTVPAGSFYGIVGPNGAGKTTTLSMITGLLRPDAGVVKVNSIDVWAEPAAAKRSMGVLPDRMRLFDRLTGAQLLYYSGVLRGLDNATVRSRVKSLTKAFALEDAVGRLVSDYSVGMSKKIALACALIHSPRVLVLDEPFESVDPVSAASITEILQKYAENGGTVILSSHGMEFIERVCDNVAIIVGGEVLADGTVDSVRGGSTLEERFIELVGGRKATEDLEWLHSFSD